MVPLAQTLMHLAERVVSTGMGTFHRSSELGGHDSRSHYPPRLYIGITCIYNASFATLAVQEREAMLEEAKSRQK